MKRKILCLILCLMLLPCAYVLSACKKDAGYDITKLEEDYVAVFSNYNTLKLDEQGYGYGIQVDLSQYPAFASALATYPYSAFNEYKLILDNMTLFSNEYVTVLSQSSTKASKETRNTLKSQLSSFSNSLKNLNSQINTMGDMCSVYSDYMTNELCRRKLEQLFDSFSGVYQSAYNFSTTLAKVYFENQETDVPNYFYTNIDEFDPMIAVVNMRIDAYTKTHIVDLTNIFVEENLDGGTKSHDVAFVTKVGQMNMQDAELVYYKNRVASVNKTITANDIEILKTNATKVENFYNGCIKLYNIQKALDSTHAVYIKACNAIHFAGVSKNVKTADEQMNVLIIRGYSITINEYNAALADLIAQL